MAAEYAHTDQFRGARFTAADLSGATFRDCTLTQVRIVGCEISGLRVSGYRVGARGIVVEDVDVTAFVSDELDRRHPERVQLRAVRTADDHRAMWDTVDRLWSETIARAERLPDDTRDARVDDEWSVVETLRHLVFAVDLWIGRRVLGEAMPFDRAGLPPTDYPTSAAAELGIDLDARPSFDEAVALFDDRRARVRRVIGAVSDDGLAEIHTAVPASARDEESHSVGACLRVVMDECCEHRRYAERDLARLEAR